MCVVQYIAVNTYMCAEKDLDVFVMEKSVYIYICTYIYMCYTKLSDISDRIQSEMLHAFKEKKMLCTNLRACALHNHHIASGFWYTLQIELTRDYIGTIAMIIIAQEKLFFFHISRLLKMCLCLRCADICAGMYIQCRLLCLCYTRGYVWYST